MDPDRLTIALKQEAVRLGFDLVGACRAASPPGIERFRRWLDAGYAGHMHYLTERASAYEHPRHVLDGVQSILMLGMNYRTVEPLEAGFGQGRVSRYAWSVDYHDVIRRGLRSLVGLHRRLLPEASARGVVDTAPLLERDFAQLAGLGWIGKNTLLLNRRFGSWIFLAALLTSEPLEYDAPDDAPHCGTCRACIDACPTGALVDDYQLDARRCIAYLTIELRDAIPIEFRDRMGPWVFGCDACQEVCPWNRRPTVSKSEVFLPLPAMNPAELADWFFRSELELRHRFRRTPLWRAKRSGLLYNAAISLGNRPHEPALPALCHGLDDPEPRARAGCAWALGQYESPRAKEVLTQRLAIEADPVVRAEIQMALDE